jgi:hypothetical protein
VQTMEVLQIVLPYLALVRWILLVDEPHVRPSS